MIMMDVVKDKMRNEQPEQYDGNALWFPGILTTSRSILRLQRHDRGVRLIRFNKSETAHDPATLIEHHIIMADALITRTQPYDNRRLRIIRKCHVPWHGEVLNPGTPDP